MDFLIPNTSEPEGLAKCRLCEESFHWIGDHVVSAHSLGLADYLERFPGAETCSLALKRKFEETAKTRTPAKSRLSVGITFAGIPFSVDLRVPASACLPSPEHYATPKTGRLALDVQDVAVSLKRSRSIWIWGPPGTGKDAVLSAWCAQTRRPSLLFTIVQGADVTAWKYSRSFDAEGTSWEEGRLLKALRDGYLAPNGERVPYLIVFSDFDRATRQQAEELRQILDSIQGRITGPTGEVWPVFPGTTIVATANTSGSGDATGRCISANPIDASILDRFERKIKFHSMHKEDEEPILQAKFPRLHESFPKVIGAIMNGTEKVREAIAKEEVYCEWSHRTVCAWAGAIEDLLVTLPRAETKGPKPKETPSGLVKRGARVVLDGLPDTDTRDNVKRILDPHISGGMVGAGNTDHIASSGLGPGDW